jgi:hypothetical protein
MKIVKFGSGFYAIRRFGWNGWEYRDLNNEMFWWRKDSVWFTECLTSNILTIKRALTIEPKPIVFSIKRFMRLTDKEE